MAHRNRLIVAQYTSVLMAVHCGMNSTRRTPFQSQKTMAGLSIFQFILNTQMMQLCKTYLEQNQQMTEVEQASVGAEC
jgi:hypothetical protein